MVGDEDVSTPKALADRIVGAHSAREAHGHSRRRSRLDIGAAGDRYGGDRRIPRCAKRGAGGGTAQRGGGLIFVI